MAIRLVEKGKNYQLICRKKSQEPAWLRDKKITGEGEKEKPPFVQWNVDISLEQYDDLFKAIKDTSVPIVPDFQYGMDGSLYSLELNVMGYHSKFSWWSVPPKGYEPLEKFAHDLFVLSKAEEVALKKS